MATPRPTAAGLTAATEFGSGCLLASTMMISVAATAVSTSGSSAVNSCAAASRPSQTPVRTGRPRPVTSRSSASIISGARAANWMMVVLDRGHPHAWREAVERSADKCGADAGTPAAQNDVHADGGQEEPGGQQYRQAGGRAGQLRHRRQHHPGSSREVFHIMLTPCGQFSAVVTSAGKLPCQTAVPA